MDDAIRNNSKKLNIGTVIAGKYKLLEKIGAGSFGMVFRTQNLKNGDLLAAKFEKRDSAEKGVSLLVREIKVLSELSGAIGFPSLKFYGRDEHYNFFMETYLGQNLEQLMRKCGGKFSQCTTIRIGIQILERLKVFHEKNFIHRDIKPENFTISRQDVTQIYAIDFGLAKYFRDTGGKHIPFTNNKGLIGTARYASVNALQGNEQSRRDDIESLIYVLIYFLLGELPWQNIQVTSKEEKYKQILLMKQSDSLEKLNHKIPKSLIKILKLSKQYEFTQTPDYEAIINLLNQDLPEEQTKFEWEKFSETIGDKMSVSIEIDNSDNIFDDMQDTHKLGLQNSMRKIIQQETKFINGRLNNSRNNLNCSYLEVPKNSLILTDAQSPSKSIKSFNTSKMNHYEASHHLQSMRQFSDLRVKSCEHFRKDDNDEDEANSDDQPCINFKNLVISRVNSKM